MPIDRQFRARAFSLAAAVFLAAFPLRATTIEVESDDETIGPTPTSSVPAPVPSASKQAAPSQASPQTQLSPATPNLETQPVARRVRISDNVGFYYFLKAGYVADPDKVPSIGQVIGSSDYNMSYSALKKTFIETDSDKVKLSTGDLLVIYRTVQPINESHSGDLGYQVENLAIVRVIETQTRRYLVEVVKSFAPFQQGDKVESYDNEIQRWKQAQIKKPLPSEPVKCYVLGGWGQAGQLRFNQLDYIYLSAGTKEGVVEGQTFRLWKVTDTGVMEESLRMPAGEAQVIFAGPDSSTAQILRNSEPIEKSFEADYKP